MNKKQYEQEVEETTKAYQYVLATRDITSEEIEYLIGVNISELAKKETTKEQIVEAMQTACNSLNTLINEIAQACGSEYTQIEEQSVNALMSIMEQSAEGLVGDVGGITMFFMELALKARKMKAKLAINEVLKGNN